MNILLNITKTIIKLGVTSVIMFASLIASGMPGEAVAADFVVPNRPHVPRANTESSGIWGALAFSPTDGTYGFFWGADKQQEAESIVLKHCNRTEDAQCKLVLTFRNHRHWTDDDNSDFPYKPCAALSVAKGNALPVRNWGAAAAHSKREAIDLAKQQCGDSQSCVIKEWVCT